MPQQSENNKLQISQGGQSQIVQIKENYGSSQRFLELFNPDIQVKVGKNIERAYFGKAPFVGEVMQAYSEDILLTWFFIQIEDLNTFCKSKDKIDEVSLRQLSMMLISSAPYFKITEFMLFFYRLKLATYGVFFGSIDPQLILSYFQKFKCDRVAEIASIENKKSEAERKQKYIEWDAKGMSRNDYEEYKRLNSL